MAQLNLVITDEVKVPRSEQQAAEPSSVVCNLAHELRQPLSTVETAAYYLKLILADVEPRASNPLDKIQQMVQQMNWILADAVHYLQAGTSHPQNIDLTEFITDQLAGPAMQLPVEMDWTKSSSPPLVRMDPGQAEHMVRAILSVFRQLGRAGCTVRVSFYRTGEKAVLECSCEASDQLCGEAGDLLQPFATQLPPGSGLALASVKRIAEVHSGRISLQSERGVLKLEVSLPSC